MSELNMLVVVSIESHVQTCSSKHQQKLLSSEHVLRIGEFLA